MMPLPDRNTIPASCGARPAFAIRIASRILIICALIPAPILAAFAQSEEGARSTSISNGDGRDHAYADASGIGIASDDSILLRQELEHLEKKHQRQALWNGILIGVSIVLLMLVAILLVRLRFQRKSERLYRARSEELEVVDRLVKLINREVSLERLYRALLDQGRVLLHEADRAAVLMYDEETDGFRLTASFGFEEQESQSLILPSPLLSGDWVKDVSRVEKLDGGMSLFHFGTDRCSGTVESRCPISRLIVDIELDGRIAGIILFDNCRNDTAFRASEIDTWSRFREHAILAIAKARLIEDMHAARLSAEEASSIKTRMLSIASHDLKNPLGIVIGLADVIIGESESNQNVKELAGMIRDSGKRMLSLLYDLLDLSELEAGRITMNFRATELVALAESVVGEYLPLAARKNQSIEFECEAAKPLHVMADSRRLREAIANLVDNAVKFSQPGASIRVLLRGGNSVRVEVRDDGPGLTDRDKELAFGQFQRLSARPTGGEASTGIGLSIVRQIVELHGGKVRVESEEGQGAAFIIEL